MIPLGKDFRALRIQDPRKWLAALDQAVALSRQMDPSWLPSWGGTARVAGVKDEWIRYVVRADELASRYRYLPWRTPGTPPGSPKTEAPTFDPEMWEDLENPIFRYPTFQVDTRAVLARAADLRPMWLDPNGFVRLQESIPQGASGLRKLRPVLAVHWWGGPFPIDGWERLYLSALGGIRAVPCLCLSPTASLELLKLPVRNHSPAASFPEE